MKIKLTKMHDINQFETYVSLSTPFDFRRYHIRFNDDDYHWAKKEVISMQLSKKDFDELLKMVYSFAKERGQIDKR